LQGKLSATGACMVNTLIWRENDTPPTSGAATQADSGATKFRQVMLG
jgi:hypothetical protein